MNSLAAKPARAKRHTRSAASTDPPPPADDGEAFEEGVEKALVVAEKQAPPKRAVPDPHPLYEQAQEELAHLPAGYVEPWTRRPDEGDHAWEMFRFYRDLGPSRTIAMVAEEFKTKLPTLHNTYTSRFDWLARAAAWDKSLDRLYRIGLQEQVKEMSQRHASQIVGTLEALAIPFNEIRRRVEKGGTTGILKGLTNMDVRRLFDLALKGARVMAPLMAAERLARGMPTEIIQSDSEVRVIHDIGTDQLTEVLSVLARAGVLDGPRDTGGTGEVVDAEVVAVDDDQPDGAAVQREAARATAAE